MQNVAADPACFEVEKLNFGKELRGIRAWASFQVLPASSLTNTMDSRSPRRVDVSREHDAITYCFHVR